MYTVSLIASMFENIMYVDQEDLLIVDQNQSRYLIKKEHLFTHSFGNGIQFADGVSILPNDDNIVSLLCL